MEDYEAFARTIGALLYNTSHVDIIQLALKEPEESAVYKAALKITSERPQRLFFDWKNRKGARSPLSGISSNEIEKDYKLDSHTYIHTI